jgi:hypothetical protein
MSRRFTKAKSIEYKVVPNAGHFVSMQQPKYVATEIMQVGDA